MTNEKETLSIAEAARLWGCSRIAALYWINEARRAGFAETVSSKTGAARIAKSDALALNAVFIRRERSR
jgi:hypothetical protein